MRKGLVGVQYLWSLLLPVSCVACGEEGDWVCNNCVKTVRLNREETCFCGTFAEQGLCAKHTSDLALDGLTSLFSYANPTVRELIHCFKYKSLTDTLRFIEAKYRRVIASRLPRGEWAAVPIPLWSERLRQRGFNQSQLLAEHLLQPLFEVKDILKRTRPTETQTHLKKKERSKNVRGSFAIKANTDVPERVILVDDVLTTGSTIREAAKVLRKAGVKEVWAFTLAHG